MKFAKYTYRFAGIYGLAVLLPQYFMENKVGLDFPPAITHPEFYYGFIGTAVAFQIVFFILSSDPIRYRPIMLATMVEKMVFCVPALLLFLGGRAPTLLLVFGFLDFVFAVLFFVAYRKTRSRTLRSIDSGGV